MFKKLIALMMVISMFTVSANAATQTGLKAAFDELNYSLSVEWDQTNKDFYSAQMKKFSSSVNALQAKGLTNAELVAFVKSEVKDARVAKDLETAFNMIQINKMTSEDASKYMVETMKKSYSTGASWNGEVFVYLAVAVLIVGIAVAISRSSNSNNGSASCVSYQVCQTNCYDDYYYGYTCYDDCYYTC
jgi:hypothetical protein